MPLHSIDVVLFGPFWGLLDSASKANIQFEDWVSTKGPQLPGTHLDKCWCVAQYLFLCLFWTWHTLIEWLHSPKLPWIHPQNCVLLGQIEDPVFIHTQTLPFDPDVLHLVQYDHITQLWPPMVLYWWLRANPSWSSNKQLEKVAFFSYTAEIVPLLLTYF